MSVTLCDRPLVTTVSDLPEEKLGQVFTIQGITGTGFGVLLHAVEHMAYHTGQIIYNAKQLVGEQMDLEFYPHLK